jgi:hypothetical protein
MAVYLVACEQNGTSEAPELFEALRGLGAEPILGSVFVVSNSGDAQSLHRYLSDFLQGEDRIFVTRLTEDFSGYVLSEAAPWLASQRPL